jgi:hypothetical protein
MLVSVSLQRRSIHPLTQADAKAAWAEFRTARGWKGYRPILTKPDENQKLEKSGADALVYGLSLAPAILSGNNVCAFSTPECRRGCVAFSGNGRYDKVTNARICKTQFLVADPSAFTTCVIGELEQARDKLGDRLGVRLNTFSDIPWETIHPAMLVPGIRFYDYTKDWSRTSTDRYHLTFSASERTTDEQIVDKVAQGENVAVVFRVGRTKPLPEKYLGIPVVNGDKTDVRFLDPKGVIVGLRAKGRMLTGDWKMVRQP